MTTFHAVAGLGHVLKTRTMKCTVTRGITATMFLMTGMKIGYARVSTNDQDLTAQRNALFALGVEEAQIFVDHGLTGANRVRPGLREAMAAVPSRRHARGDQTRPVGTFPFGCQGHS